MVLYSVYLTEHVKEVGFQKSIENFRKAMTEDLNIERICRLMETPGQLRLVHEDDWKIRRTAESKNVLTKIKES